MTITHRGSWGYRFWWRGALYKKEGWATKKRARDEEWKRRREVGTTGPRGGRLSAIAFPDAARVYLDEVVAHHRNAPNERRCVGLFQTFFRAHPVSTIRPADVDAYKQWRTGHPGGHGRPIKGATVNRDLTYLSAFFSWCMRQGWRPDNPASARVVPRAPEPQPTRIALTLAQLRHLLRLSPTPRERAKVLLLYLTGVRVSVVLELRWEQIDWRHRLLHYRSKGKDRVIPLSRRTIRLLQGLAPKPEGWVFPSPRSRSGHDTLYRTIRWWARARAVLGLPTLRRHELRVSVARELASQGVDLVTIRELGGWSSLAMVERYTPAYLAQARRAVERLRA